MAKGAKGDDEEGYRGEFIRQGKNGKGSEYGKGRRIGPPNCLRSKNKGCDEHPLFYFDNIPLPVYNLFFSGI